MTIVRLTHAVLKTLTVFLVALGGCASMQVKPDINLIDLRLSEVRLLETTLLATLRVHNDSNQALTFSGSTHRIYINDIELGRASSDEALTIPRLSSATYTVPVRISSLGVLTRLQTLIDSRNFDYRIESSLYPRGGFGWTSINTTNAGSFNGLRDALADRDQTRVRTGRQ